jgi:AAA15 family ATPase/GTPase
MSDIIEALDKGRVIFCDNITERLHSNLAKELIALFNDAKFNPKGTQIIATTNDTSLMSGLRRDQIYFIEKDYHGASKLYSLAEFKIKDTANIEQGYLEGRFGATPESDLFDHLSAKD